MTCLLVSVKRSDLAHAPPETGVRRPIHEVARAIAKDRGVRARAWAAIYERLSCTVKYLCTQKASVCVVVRAEQAQLNNLNVKFEQCTTRMSSISLSDVGGGRAMQKTEQQASDCVNTPEMHDPNNAAPQLLAHRPLSCAQTPRAQASFMHHLLLSIISTLTNAIKHQSMQTRTCVVPGSIATPRFPLMLGLYSDALKGSAHRIVL